jgi:hypothetical protein
MVVGVRVVGVRVVGVRVVGVRVVSVMVVGVRVVSVRVVGVRVVSVMVVGVPCVTQNWHQPSLSITTSPNYLVERGSSEPVESNQLPIPLKTISIPPIHASSM